MSSLSLVLYLLHDMSGQISLYVTLNEREPLHGLRGNFVFFPPPVNGLPLPLRVPRLSPRSFSGKVYEGRVEICTVYQLIISAATIISISAPCSSPA
jgi:hypothetical protein